MAEGKWSPDSRAVQILQEALLESYINARLLDSFESELVGELDQLSQYVIQADTRTYCILMVSFLEDALKRNFVRFWEISGSAENERFFGSNGPLSTFTQRTLVASALQWLSPSFAKEADALRKVRNHLAHSHKTHSLSHEPLQSLVSKLRPRENTWASMEEYQDALAKADSEKRLRLRVFCSATLIAASALAKSRLLKEGLAGLMREGGYEKLMEVEQQIIDITVAHCFIALGIRQSSQS